MDLVHDRDLKWPGNPLETYKALTKQLLVAYKVITNQVDYKIITKQVAYKALMYKLLLQGAIKLLTTCLQVFYKALTYKTLTHMGLTYKALTYKTLTYMALTYKALKLWSKRR